jgi:hypothetical protein
MKGIIFTLLSLISVLGFCVTTNEVDSFTHFFTQDYGISESYHHQVHALDFPRLPLTTSDPLRSWRLTQILSEDSVDAVWYETGKGEYFYNLSIPSRIDSFRTYSQAIGSSWILESSLHFTYDSTGEYVTLGEIYNVTQIGYAVPELFFTAEYNAEHHVSHIYRSEFDYDSLQVIPSSREHYFYNNGILISKVRWSRYTNNYYKNAFQLDAQGRVSIETYSISSDSLNWTPHYRYNYSYHPADTMTGEQFADLFSHYFSLYYLLFVNPPYGMVAQEIYYDYNNSSWTPISRHLFTYNGNNQLTEELIQFPETQWVNAYRYLYTYAANGNLFRYQDYDWDENSGSWIAYDERTTYTWEQITSDQDETNPQYQNLPVNIYPNPCSPQTAVSFTLPKTGLVKINICNLKGQLVKTLADCEFGKGEHSVSWDGKDYQNKPVATGIYLCKLRAGSVSTVRKLVLRK